MAVDQNSIPVPRVRDLDTNFVDDDELQAALARSRRAKIRKPKKITPEELARRGMFSHALFVSLCFVLLMIMSFPVAEEREEQEKEAIAASAIKVEDGEDVNMDAEGDDSGDGGLVFDDTSEFVRAVGNNPIAVKKESKDKLVVPPAQAQGPSRPRSSSRDVSMAPGDEALNELDTVAVKNESDDEDDDMEILNRIEEAIKAEENETQVEGADAGGEDDGVGGTSSQQTFKSGMASTLNILRQQGILATPAADQKDRERTQLQRDLWLADQRRRIAQRELERLQTRGGNSNKDQATREYENRLREQQEARENLETFKNYKPDVNIVYYDEHGRSLTPKEAWKALSHKFHGKGSGKMKTEKRLKRIEEEKKQAAMASGDTPLSMSKAFQERQMKAGQAHFVLSVGNRGYVLFCGATIFITLLTSVHSAVPQVADFIDAQPLSKGKTEKMKKKKESKNANKAATMMESGIMTIPTSLAGGVTGSPGPSGGFGFTPSSSPGPRAGFSRISSGTGDALFQNGAAGESGDRDRTKVAFGFGTKRKAGEDAPGSPPTKRR